MTHHHHSGRKEGLTAGILGALAVAAMYLVIDLVNGRPLATPNLLGQVVLFRQAAPVEAIQPSAVIAYTIAHIAVFAAVGLLAARLVRIAILQPTLRFAFFLVVLFFEFFYTMFAYAIDLSAKGHFPLGTALAANLLAIGIIGLFLWKRHPALRRAIHRDPFGLESTEHVEYKLTPD